MDLLTSIGYFGFGLLVGMLLLEARWRLRVSVMDKLRDGEGVNWKNDGGLTEDHKSIILVGSIIILVVVAITVGLNYYHARSFETERELAKIGLKWQPMRQAGWYPTTSAWHPSRDKEFLKNLRKAYGKKAE